MVGIQYEVNSKGAKGAKFTNAQGKSTFGDWDEWNPFLGVPTTLGAFNNRSGVHIYLIF